MQAKTRWDSDFGDFPFCQAGLLSQADVFALPFLRSLKMCLVGIVPVDPLEIEQRSRFIWRGYRKMNPLF
jgi:hypothetical protein